MDPLLSSFGPLLDDPNLPLACGLALIAGLLRGFAGFGSAMLMAPVFAVLFGSAEMVATVVAMELAISFQLFPSARRECNWSMVAPMTIASCIAMAPGIWLLVALDKVLIIKIVSAIVAAFAVIMFTGWRWRGRQGPVPSAFVGLLSGAMMGSTGIGGPPVLLYMLSGSDSPATVRANAIIYYFVTQILLLAILFVIGVAGTTSLLRAVLLFPFMLAGSWIGGHVFRGSNETVYRNVALSLLLAVGLFGLLS